VKTISHLYPAGRCDDAAEYAVELSFTGDNPYRIVEKLWCRPVSGKVFELCCIPFVTYNLALGDFISLEELENQMYAIMGAVSRSDNATFRAWITEMELAQTALTQKLNSLGCLAETLPPNLVAINATRDQGAPLEQTLEMLANQGYLTYERSFGPRTIDFKVHKYPVWKDRSNYIVQARVEHDEEREIREQIWARQIEDHTFEICCIPFFVFDLALSDIVEVSGAGPEKGLIQRVVQRSDHDTYWIYFNEKRWGNIQRSTESKIREIALFEWYGSDLLAVDVTPDQGLQVVRSLSSEIESSELMVVSSRTQSLVTPT